MLYVRLLTATRPGGSGSTRKRVGGRGIQKGGPTSSSSSSKSVLLLLLLLIWRVDDDDRRLSNAMVYTGTDIAWRGRPPLGR